MQDARPIFTGGGVSSCPTDGSDRSPMSTTLNSFPASSIVEVCLALSSNLTLRCWPVIVSALRAERGPGHRDASETRGGWPSLAATSTDGFGGRSSVAGDPVHLQRDRIAHQAPATTGTKYNACRGIKLRYCENQKLFGRCAKEDLDTKLSETLSVEQPTHTEVSSKGRRVRCPIVDSVSHYIWWSVRSCFGRSVAPAESERPLSSGQLSNAADRSFHLAIDYRETGVYGESLITHKLVDLHHCRTFQYRMYQSYTGKDCGHLPRTQPRMPA
ncbi:hypothetical protein U1Q18_052289 [Sarracenia purpurea var. burkii]